jgi:hypothetical protein
LFLGGRFDVEVDQFLAIDDRDAQFFGLRRIEQHAFHVFLPRAPHTGRQTAADRDRLHSGVPSNAASGHGARIRNQPELFFMAGPLEWANQPAVYSK